METQLSMRRKRRPRRKAVGVVLLLLVAVLGYRTFSFGGRQRVLEPVERLALNNGAVAERLARAVRIPTISTPDPADMPVDAFLELHGALVEMFPRVHERLERETPNELGLLYTWKGTKPDLPPLVLLAHQDVVPVQPGTEGDWSQPPFSGSVDSDWVWGRGTMDFKHGVVGILQAVELLLESGVEQPMRTTILAFGHDEEVGGQRGAKAMAALLQARYGKAHLVLDEGMAIIEGMMPGIEGPVALIGLAEKGFVTLRLSIVTTGGHSSMPPPNTAVGILGAALGRLEENPLPPRIDEPVSTLFRFLGPEMGWSKQLIFANRWLFGPLLIPKLAEKNTTNALIRTTTAATVFHGGVQDNVLPISAEAQVNFRILPGDSIESVVDHVRTTLDDERITIDVEGFKSEPSAVSPVDSEAFAALQSTIHEVFPECLVAPSLVVGATDARHYAALTNNVLRFSPLQLVPEDPARIHGTDERISVEAFADEVRFYVRLIQNVSLEAP